MKLKHVGMIVVSVLAMSSAAVSAAEGDESVTTTVNGGVIHFKGEVVNAACAIDSESMNQTEAEIRVILRGILFQITVLLCQQAAALLIVVMSPWISRTFLEAQKYPLAYIAQANKSSHFIFRVPPLTVPDKCLLTQHLMQQKHREWVSL